MPEFVRRTPLPVSAEAAYEWHLRPGAFVRLTPPWEDVRPISLPQNLAEGCRAEMSVPLLGPVRKTWVARHQNFIAGRQFQDVQVSGPFACWRHTHKLEPQGPDGCVLEDRIEYTLPLQNVGGFVGGPLVRSKLDRMFRYRHAVTRHDLMAHLRTKAAPMRILVTGSTGLVGSALVPFLTTGGHEVVRLIRSRSPSTSKELVHWDPASGQIDAAGLEGIDGVVHLAGEAIASGRWNAEKKRRIHESRGPATKLLCQALAKLTAPPKVLVSASAIGFYGDRGDEELIEASAPGTGFLPDVCQAWEAGTEPAREAGIRVVNFRIGIVLTPRGGALQPMLTPFKMCVGGVMGSGRQYWSWIALDDLVGAIHHCLVTPTLHGPVNGTAPLPVTNRVFTKTLGKVLGRPTVFPMPAFAARLALGEMANDLILASARVLPRQLEESGYVFRYPELEPALRHVLGR